MPVFLLLFLVPLGTDLVSDEVLESIIEWK